MHSEETLGCNDQASRFTIHTKLFIGQESQHHTGVVLLAFSLADKSPEAGKAGDPLFVYFTTDIVICYTTPPSHHALAPPRNHSTELQSNDAKASSTVASFSSTPKSSFVRTSSPLQLLSPYSPQNSIITPISSPHIGQRRSYSASEICT